MHNLKTNLERHLKCLFKEPAIMSGNPEFRDADGNIVFSIFTVIAQDFDLGIRQRAIVVENLGERQNHLVLAHNIEKLFDGLDKNVYLKMGNPSGNSIDSKQLTTASKVILYTNKICDNIQEIATVFDKYNTRIEIINESEMHKTLFISYGGPDEEVVKKLNNRIKLKGVKTWFFPDDAKPGEKLHRMMSNGVNNHDHVLLICSKNSLSRPGVLTEIERVLEKEAKEGGIEILIPVTIDNFVFKNWAPERVDIADQIRSRVITKVNMSDENIDPVIEKIVSVLKK